ncbi:MAG: AmmeMemoRadiSam system radical SAM enzyme [Candidatus Omnitrophica bacterium]|nr:AmmeMemoRadiSam system radical SAM enzyme [Candidatus Omnitrophota bacterium]
MKEASFYDKKESKRTDCFLCNHFCHIPAGKTGLCAVRINQEGTLYSLSYGKVIAANIDPIEKKPLFHFLPGSPSYSIACMGCNFQCDFCQNWQISQAQEAKKAGLKAQDIEPEKIVNDAFINHCPSISYTYTEPTIYFEFAYECSKLAKEKGLRNIFVTNGYMSSQAIQAIAPYLDAANVDLKSFSEEFYKKICKAKLQPVLQTIALMNRLDIWVEVTTLLIPGLNDSAQELSQIASFIASVDKNIPWHISAFHPDYRRTQIKHTQAAQLEKAQQIGKEKGLAFVYTGNITIQNGENTYCPNCNKAIIERLGFSVKNNIITHGACKNCGQLIKGVWQ